MPRIPPPGPCEQCVGRLEAAGPEQNASCFCLIESVACAVAELIYAVMTPAPIHFQLNGETRAAPGPLPLPDLLQDLGLTGKRVAVEVNGQIVPRSQHADCTVKAADRIEIVQAIGGG